MFIQNFHTAAKEHGKYCHIKGELRVRKGRKVYLFKCREFELRFAAPARPEIMIPVSPDATVHDLRRGIRTIMDLYGSNEKSNKSAHSGRGKQTRMNSITSQFCRALIASIRK